jgi:hypothetical protein
LFILAHQVRGVSSENNRPDTYPTEFAQVSGVQSVKHLVCKCHHTTERRVGYSWRHIGLKKRRAHYRSIRSRICENEYRVRQVKMSRLAVLRTCRT